MINLKKLKITILIIYASKEIEFFYKKKLKKEYIS